MGKKTLIFIIVGVVVLLAGIGGGVFVGLTYFSGETKTSRVIEPPGPVQALGDFTVNLADPEPHIARLGVTIELVNQKALELVLNPSWDPILKNEVLLTVKDRRFQELKSAEGVQALAQDLRNRMNALLPMVKDVPPIKQVLFSQFVLQ